MPSSVSERYDFGAGGPILRIQNEGRRFLTIFSGESKHFRMLTWPNPDHLYIHNGAHLVNTRNPEESAVLPGLSYSTNYTYPIPSLGLILIGNDHAIYCYDAQGLRWEQRDLFCCDDPASIAVDGNDLVLYAYFTGRIADRTRSRSAWISEPVPGSSDFPSASSSSTRGRLAAD